MTSLIKLIDRVAMTGFSVVVLAALPLLAIAQFGHAA